MAAGQLGIRSGMQLSEARARCAALDVRTWDEHAVNDAVLAGTATLLSASPQVTPASGTPGMWWVGAGGFENLGGEQAFAHSLLQLVQTWHPEARVAIANSCVAARAATWTPSANHLTIIPPGYCAHYLAPAPLGLIPMPEELRKALQALGLRTVGALAALQPADVEERWGRDGLSAWRLAHGDDPRRPGLRRSESPRSATAELPGAVDRVEPVLFVLRAQLQRLLNACVEDGRAAASVAITLILDAGRSYPLEEIGETAPSAVTPVTLTTPAASATPAAPATPAASATPATHAASLLGIPQRSITREVRPARPLARLDPIFDQCRSLLESWAIPAPIIGVGVSIPATAPLAADQGDLLIPSWRDAAMNAESVFARLRALLDSDNQGDVIVNAESRDSHRPESTGAWVPVALDPSNNSVQNTAQSPSQNPPQNTSSPSSGTSRITLNTSQARLLPGPEPVTVTVRSGASPYTPCAVRWRNKHLRFVSVHGPERLSGEWWQSKPYARDYWRCSTEHDGDMLLYCEDRQWYVQGWYD